MFTASTPFAQPTLFWPGDERDRKRAPTLWPDDERDRKRAPARHSL